MTETERGTETETLARLVFLYQSLSIRCRKAIDDSVIDLSGTVSITINIKVRAPELGLSPPRHNYKVRHLVVDTDWERCTRFLQEISECDFLLDW